MTGRGSGKKQKRMSGLTLIELMIGIAVLIILLGVALPGYREYILRSNRTEAMDTLLKIAACQERVYTMFKRYEPERCDIGPGTGSGKYAIIMATSNVNQNYTLTATAQLDQARDPCGNLTLTDQGERGTSVTTDRARIADCWQEK